MPDDKPHFPFPFPRPWFPKLPERASLDFSALIEVVNAQPADSPAWTAVKAVDAARQAGDLDGLSADLAARPTAEVIAEALAARPDLAAALRASFGEPAQADALLHPLFLGLQWGLLRPPS